MSIVTTQVMEPVTEALHLRRLIEQQPACLLRAGIDGLLLAVNGAGLRLLGGESLTQVLGTKLTKLIMPRQHEEWNEFAARVREGASASIECDLTDLVGMRRTILLQGVPLLDHADGVPSMILTARDISAPRRLEAALRESAITRELDHLQKELQGGVSEPPQGEGALTEREIDLQPAIAPAIAEAERIQIRQALAEEHEAALLLKEREAQHLLDSVRAELEQARAEQQRLTTLLGDREIGHERVLAAHAAERTQLQQTLADEHQLALLLKEREGRLLLDSARTELEQARAEQQRLTMLLDEREVDHQRAVAAHAAAVAEQAAAVAEHAAAQTELRLTLAEQHRLALVLNERGARELLDSARIELEQALAEQQRLATLLEDRDIDHQRAVAALAAERAQLQQTLAEEHQLALLLKERDGRQLLDNVRTELERAIADRQHFATTLDERDVMIAEHAARRADGEEALAAAVARQAEIERALAAQHLQLQTVEENARTLERLAAAGRVAVAVGRELETIVAAVDARTQYLLVESALDSENRHLFEALRVDAIDAASLTRQILQIQDEIPMIADSSKAGTEGRASDEGGREL
jgi:PAS domain S-box-containing protein